MFQYSKETWFILIAMVGTGAARTLAVKILYQIGLEAPLYVTLLYLLGQTLSLGGYGMQRWNAEVPEEGKDEGETGGDEEEAGEGGFKEKATIFGSLHGLKQSSQDSIAWTRKIPFLLKPAIPAVCNMLNSVLRWAAFVYIAASSSGLLYGIGLSLSLVYSRIIPFFPSY